MATARVRPGNYPAILSYGFRPFFLLGSLQAGLAIALSLLFARTFPQFGEEAGTLTLGIVAINELIAPALLRWAFVRSGEGAATESAASTSSPGVPVPVPGGH